MLKPDAQYTVTVPIEGFVHEEMDHGFDVVLEVPVHWRRGCPPIYNPPDAADPGCQEEKDWDERDITAVLYFRGHGITMPWHMIERMLQLPYVYAKLEAAVEASEPPSFEDVERDPDIPAAVLRDCWNCETPITLIGRSGNDVSPPICPHCGAIDPCGHGPVKRT